MKAIKTLWVILMYLFQIIGSANTLSVPGVYPTIQSALDSASTGDTILVSPGTYHETIIWPETYQLKLIATGDSSNTFIDANYQGRPITFPGQIYLDSSTVIKGFTIRNGIITSYEGFGGGIYLKNAGIILDALHICYNVIQSTSKSYGGGIYCEQSNPIIKNCIISHNTISGSISGGGGFACQYSNPIIANSSVSNNHLGISSYGYGGGVCILNESALQMEYSQINANSSNDSISWCYGGGFYAHNVFKVIFRNVSVSSNKMGNRGSWHYGGGIYIESADSVALENVVVDSNHTGFGNKWNNGGGIFIRPYPLHPPNIPVNCIFTNVRVTNNILGDSASYYKGGGIMIQGRGSVQTVNFLVSDNIMGVGGNFYNGGGIWTDSVTIFLANATIANNRRSDNGAIVGSGLNFDNATPGVFSINTIFWNPPSVEINQLSSFNASHSNVRGGIIPGQNNISSDPLFAGNVDYRLQPGSPCIGIGTFSGSPLFDIENNPRPMPVGTNPDMGVFEEQTINIGIENRKNLSKVQVFPNPANDKISINLKEMECVELFIYDLAGKLLLTRNLDVISNEININALLPGTYIVRVSGASWSSVEKLMVL